MNQHTAEPLSLWRIVTISFLLGGIAATALNVYRDAAEGQPVDLGWTGDSPAWAEVRR